MDCSTLSAGARVRITQHWAHWQGQREEEAATRALGVLGTLLEQMFVCVEEGLGAWITLAAPETELLQQHFRGL